MPGKLFKKLVTTLLVLMATSYILSLIPLSVMGATLPLPSSEVFCPDSKKIPRPVGLYPMGQDSPMKALSSHDVVFIGEVLVPAKRCSLGVCAGVAVRQILKGDIIGNILMRIDAGPGMTCLHEEYMTQKHQYWYIFASSGTSKYGQKYFEMTTSGPSFPTKFNIDFVELDKLHQKQTKDLDYAIKSTLGIPY